MSAAATSTTLFQLRNSSLPFPLGNNQSGVPQSNVVLGLCRKVKSGQRFATKKSAVLEKKFMGARLRPQGSESMHFWRSDGPGREPKLRVVVRSALSGVPEKPLGLYDPSFDKDSCGVGFVAELSGETSRKTV